ncbi:MAG TPA: hypothetical protein H9960_09010 [Candidatus Duodenibacillus intestinigallinarum]|nr:hypothetical protein [Candidatus Duodenibacillus intestinigallinarum]
MAITIWLDDGKNSQKIAETLRENPAQVFANCRKSGKHLFLGGIGTFQILNCSFFLLRLPKQSGLTVDCGQLRIKL